MIDVEDLMVGNWVKSPQGVIQVHNVLTDGIIAKHEGKSIYIFHATDIKPVPVAIEILKTIGFEEYEDLPLEGKFYRYWDKEYKYKLDVDEGYTNSGKMWSVHIDNGDCATIGSGEFDYVHELQNLIRINCKADLPITKEVFYGLGNDA